jgi:2-keto-3-deoxy-L-rhamnonate aldolase RhmA
MSFSLGLRGQQDHPRVEEAASRVLEAARRHGKIAGRPASTLERTKRFIEQGFLFFQAPSELALFEKGAEQFLGPHGLRPAQRQRTLY